MYDFLIYLFVMAGVTYLTRLLPMLFIRRKIENRFLKSFLHYVPYSVLTVFHCLDRRILQQFHAGGGHHDRIDHQRKIPFCRDLCKNCLKNLLTKDCFFCFFNSFFPFVFNLISHSLFVNPEMLVFNLFNTFSIFSACIF